MLPTISIITPSYQQQKFLAQCLSSIHDQGYPELEHIVVDGGSTDGSVELIEQYADKLHWWCSEADEGQSHAINKGLAHSTGSVFGWLNSDDMLLPGALEMVGKAFADDPDLVVFGGRRVFLGDNGIRRASDLDDASDRDALFHAPKVNQQSTFYRMDVIQRIGGADADLHYTMDLELWWQVLFSQGTSGLRFVQDELAVFRAHAESKTSEGVSPFRNETAAILRQLAMQLEQQDLVAVLDSGYVARHAARPMPVEAEHVATIRRMIIAFLLKWDHKIHERGQFEMMRRFRTSIQLEAVALNAKEKAWLDHLDEQLKAPNWLAFRLKRKFDHLTG